MSLDSWRLALRISPSDFSSGEQVDDPLNGLIGFMIGGFDFAGRLCGLRPTVEQAVGQRAADPFMKQDEQEGDADALGGEAIGVPTAVPLQEAMSLHFPQVVPDLGEGVTLGGKTEGGQQSLMNVGGARAHELGSALQEHFHHAEHAGVVNLDAGDLGAPARDGEGQPLEQREVDVHVQGLGLKGGETVGDGRQRVAHGLEVLQALVQPEIPEVVAQGFHPQEGRELLVHPQDGVLRVAAQHVMAVLDLLEHAAQLAAQALVEAEPEQVCERVGGEAEQAEVTGALEQRVDGEVAPEDDIAAVLDLLERVVAAQVDGLAVLGGKLRADHPGPVVQALADDLG